MSTNTVPESVKRRRPPGGSRKGVPNKVTKQLKDMILGALNDAGGQKYLAERARDPRTAAAFLTLLGKVLPTEIKGNGAVLVPIESVQMIPVEPERVERQADVIDIQTREIKSA